MWSRVEVCCSVERRFTAWRLNGRPAVAYYQPTFSPDFQLSLRKSPPPVERTESAAFILTDTDLRCKNVPPPIFRTESESPHPQDSLNSRSLFVFSKHGDAHHERRSASGSNRHYRSRLPNPKCHHPTPSNCWIELRELARNHSKQARSGHDSKTPSPKRHGGVSPQAG